MMISYCLSRSFFMTMPVLSQRIILRVVWFWTLTQSLTDSSGKTLLPLLKEVSILLMSLATSTT